MIDFTLTPEQQEMRDLAHTFAEKEIRPVAPELDEREEFPWELVKKAGAVGLTTFAFPEGLGGLGITDELTNCMITEELSWGCAGVATVLGGTHLASIPILIAGTDEQKQRLLKPIVERNGLCAMALTEPGAGSDVAAMTTTARREGDDYVLNGAKRFITNGGIADLYVVFADSGPRAGPSRRHGVHRSRRHARPQRAARRRRSWASAARTPARCCWMTCACRWRTGWARRAVGSGWR